MQASSRSSAANPAEPPARPSRRRARPLRPPSSGASCAVIPEETAGPFPGDGSNGPNVLAESGVVRKDIRPSFGASTTVAEGVPSTINLTIQDAGGDCAPLAGTAVYLWHCDRGVAYSLYSEAAADENYLRGVKAADDSLVYATDGYGQSVQNLTQVTLATDNVSSDHGAARQLGTVSGSVDSGLTVTAVIPVDT